MPWSRSQSLGVARREERRPSKRRLAIAWIASRNPAFAAPSWGPPGTSKSLPFMLRAVGSHSLIDPNGLNRPRP